jgi:hypothetical protein
MVLSVACALASTLSARVISIIKTVFLKVRIRKHITVSLQPGRHPAGKIFDLPIH